ncbi:neprilysin-11-like [Haemaphysalis longicornis]
MPPSTSVQAMAPTNLASSSAASTAASRPLEAGAAPHTAQSPVVAADVREAVPAAMHATTPKDPSSAAAEPAINPAPVGRTPAEVSKESSQCKRPDEAPSMPVRRLSSARSTRRGSRASDTSALNTVMRRYQGQSLENAGATLPHSDERSHAGACTQRKRNQERPIVLSSVTVIMITASVIIAKELLAQEPPPAYSVCVSPVCRAYSVHLRLSLSANVSPCESFTSFVCGDWRRRNRLSVHDEVAKDVLANMSRVMEVGRFVLDDNSAYRRAAHVFRACQSLLQGARDDLAAVKEALLEAGIVWPAVGSNADVRHSLMYSALELGWDPIFRFVPGGNASRRVVLIMPGTSFPLVQPRRRSLNASENRMKYFDELRSSFRLKKQEPAEQEATFQEIVELEERIVWSMEQSLVMSSKSPVLVNEMLEAKGGGLELWRSAIGKIQQNDSYAADFTASRPQYLETFLDFWQKLGDQKTHLFVSWCTVQVAALYANVQLVLNYYDSPLEAATVHRGLFCLSRAFLLSPYGLFANYIHDSQTRTAQAVAADMAVAVRKAFVDSLSAVDVSENSTRANGNWSVPTVSFQFFNGTFEDTACDALDKMSDSFFENWSQSSLVNVSAETLDVARAIYSLEYVVPSHEGPLVMPYALSFPLFDAVLVAAVNYGALGTEYGRALAELFVASSKAAAGPWTPRLNSFQRCLERTTSLPPADVLAVAADALGAAASFDAFKLASSAGSEHRLVGLGNYTEAQLFFMSLCFARCRGSSEPVDYALCDRALRHVRGFAASFNCSPGTPMNPPSACQLT